MFSQLKSLALNYDISDYHYFEQFWNLNILFSDFDWFTSFAKCLILVYFDFLLKYNFVSLAKQNWIYWFSRLGHWNLKCYLVFSLRSIHTLSICSNFFSFSCVSLCLLQLYNFIQSKFLERLEFQKTRCFFFSVFLQHCF